MRLFAHIATFALLLTLFLTSSTVMAQQFSPTVGISIALKESDQTEARNGLIVAKDPSEYYITRSYRDPNVAGVIAEQTDFLYTIENNEDRITLAVDGVADVWVSNTLGQVEYGDFITTSTDPGVGVKAIENGAVIGYAIENAPEGEGPHLIRVKLVLTDAWEGHPISESVFKQSGNLISSLITNAESEAQERSSGFLYLIVILVVVLASIFGFMTFGRIAINGISAVGRNPLAKNTIVKTILINSFITILFTLGSVIIALLIIR